MLLTIVDKQPGPVLKIKFAVSFNTKVNYGGDIITSEEYNIDDTAKVRFKFKINKTSFYLQPSLLAKKHELAENSTVKLLATCEALNYSEQWICTNHDYWNEMGEIAHDSACRHVNIYHLEIEIIVSKTELLYTNLYNDVESTDFSLTADDGSMAVHRECLAAHSDVFRAMLNGDWKETTKDCVELEGVTLKTLQHLKDYLYLGTVPEDGLRPLLLLANYYLIENLEATCIMKLIQGVTPENLYSLLEFAFENKISELTFAILRKTPKFNDVVQKAHQIMKKKHNFKLAHGESSSPLKKIKNEEPVSLQVTP